MHGCYFIKIALRIKKEKKLGLDFVRGVTRVFIQLFNTHYVYTALLIVVNRKQNTVIVRCLGTRRPTFMEGATRSEVNFIRKKENVFVYVTKREQTTVYARI